jgi:hypothetical protein
MKPLSIKEQIKVLKKVLYSPFIYGMCILIAEYSGHDFMDIKFSPEKLIPSFNHLAYLRFYPNVKAVQIRQYKLYWDNPTIFGNLRRRWFIRHLIKELEKQL